MVKETFFAMITVPGGGISVALSRRYPAKVAYLPLGS
jgi:hypothetical protein